MFVDWWDRLVAYWTAAKTDMPARQCPCRLSARPRHTACGKDDLAVSQAAHSTVGGVLRPQPRKSSATTSGTTSMIRLAAMAATPATAIAPRRCSPRSAPVQIEVPRDRDGSFEPQIVRKRHRRLNGVDEIVLSLTARGLTTGEVCAHFAEVYGARVSNDTISRITDKVIEEMTEWGNRPLDRVYPVIFIDALVVKVRDGQVGISRSRRNMVG